MPIPEPNYLAVPAASGGRVIVQPLSLGCGLTVLSETGATATVFVTVPETLAVIRALAAAGVVE